ncbi:MAG: Kae1-associated serine/threonine protein kinase [Asgard group archaeon]|nr:Kae1-associated serine/threonine protein kinase [Asgard group archaeon]
MKEDFRGAESKLFLKDWFGSPALYKTRLPKKYRIKELDNYFRTQRTNHEARLLARAKEAGVRVPIIYEIDMGNTTIVMEYINGEILKTLIPKLSKNNQIDICRKIGKNIAYLHLANIVHGDLTTSNILRTNNNKLAFIDFGLGYISNREEDFGIDMYLLERAFQSTHIEIFNDGWKAILNGYKEISPIGELIEQKVIEISTRGRYSDRI